MRLHPESTRSRRAGARGTSPRAVRRTARRTSRPARTSGRTPSPDNRTSSGRSAGPTTARAAGTAAARSRRCRDRASRAASRCRSGPRPTPGRTGLRPSRRPGASRREQSVRGPRGSGRRARPSPPDVSPPFRTRRRRPRAGGSAQTEPWFAATAMRSKSRRPRVSRTQRREREASDRLDSGWSLEGKLELHVPRAVTKVRGGIWVPVGEEVDVGVHLAAVAQADRAEVAKTLRHPAGEERRPPAEEAHNEEHTGEGKAEEERREGEQAPEQRNQPTLGSGRIDSEIDRIAAGSADEARERPPDEEQEGRNVRRVPHPRGDEAMEHVRDAAGHERNHPRDEDRQEHQDAPERKPDEVGNREREPEEDREAGALDAIAQLEPHRMLGQGGVLQDSLRVARRVAVGDEQQIARHLNRKPDRVGDEVAKPLRRAAAGQRREPREERRGRSDTGGGESG